VQFAGGHDPGPLALPMHPSADAADQPPSDRNVAEPPPLPGSTAASTDGPWGSHDPARPSGPWDKS